MTVRKRLFWSNILMILVPVIATALIGILCVGFIWLSLINGAGLGLKDQEDFDRACMAITEAAGKARHSHSDGYSPTRGHRSLCTSSAFEKKSRKTLPNHAILKRFGGAGYRFRG